MKVYLIKSSAPGPFKEYKKATGGPSQNIFSVAAATPAGVDIAMCDETIGMKPDMNTNADIVAMFFHTPDALHAYQLAQKYRNKGKTVVMGGLHPSFMTDEALTQCDAVMVGEAEGIWEELLVDYASGQLKKVYERTEPVDLADVNPYPTNLIPPERYGYLWSVLVSRGCVKRCEFCAVPPFFNCKYRLRPVENIVAEIKAAPAGCWFELHADNLTANRNYALSLFKALIPLKIKWFGETTLSMADDPELLQAATASGCQALLIGIETPSKLAQGEMDKGQLSPEETRDKIRVFQEHGIQVTSSMIFGFDSHTPEIFQETLEFCRFIGIDEIQPVLLIPFPGTPLFKRLDLEGRILHRDWSKYDGNNVCFIPKNMSAKDLEDGATWFWYELQKKPPAEKSLDGTTGAAQVNPRVTSGGPPVIHWKSILALAMIGLGLYFNWYWIWGVFFLMWAVNDLINGDTYLLEYIRRDQSPVMYWIVVLMWLAMGAATLIWAPDAIWAHQVHGYAAPVQWPQLGAVAGTAQLLPVAATGSSGGVTAKQPTVRESSTSPCSKQLPGNDHCGFWIKAPEGWTVSESQDSHGVYMQFDAPDESASVSVMAIDLQSRSQLPDFIRNMESVIKVDLPFVVPAEARVPSVPVARGSQQPDLVFREYSGIYAGYPTTALAGFGLVGNRGYVVVGVYCDGDTAAQAKTLSIFESFQLN